MSPRQIESNFSDVFSKLVSSQQDNKALEICASEPGVSDICKAWLAQYLPSHKDHQKALLLLQSHEKNDVLKLLGKSQLLAKDIKYTDNPEHLWETFCPSAALANTNPDSMIDEIRRRRKLYEIQPAKRPLRNLSEELLLTSNVLICPPINASSNYVPQKVKESVSEFADKIQDFWYDHPIPMDAAPAENEILYGLKNLDEALHVELLNGIIKPNKKLNMVLSLSVTHEGMEEVAFEYVTSIIKENLNLSYINIYLMSESACKNIVSEICPNNLNVEKVFGVNGAYGRHYSFLKAILAVWNRFIDRETRFTFKIDLDQVFDQHALIKKYKKTAFQILASPAWGGKALDYKGNRADLGMIAGGLVNEADSHLGLLIPDVKRPNNENLLKPLTSRRVFCSQWPQAISTEAEILQTRNNFQRVHVTGGTTGIELNALFKWRPFTPSFINRAEDQAYVFSSYQEKEYLTHLHAAGLIMRHDKAVFAKRSIAHSQNGKAIGDIERLIFFSRYASILDVDLEAIKEHFWPFTSCFIQKEHAALACLIFAIDGAVKGDKFVTDGTGRLSRSLDFSETLMRNEFDKEKEGWFAFYDALENSDFRSGRIKDTILNTLV